MKERAKNLIIFFAGSPMDRAFEAVFEGECAVSRLIGWAKSVAPESNIVFLTNKNNREKISSLSLGSFDFIERESWTNGDVASALSQACSDHKADFALYSWADTPFLHPGITKSMMDLHTRYKAEYTFADGYPYGLTPEIIDGGCASILSRLASDTQKSAGQKEASRDGLFSIMSGDINSFEIETELSPKDYRLLRLSFSCQNKGDFLACKNLYKTACEKKLFNGEEFDIIQLCDLASSSVDVLQTLPAFYNIQISARENHKTVYSPWEKISAGKDFSDMKKEDFAALCKKISDFSESAVLSLSLFGEPLLHPDFVEMVKIALSYEQFSLFIESDGTLITEELAKSLAQTSADASSRITWCILLDATEENLYSRLHNCPPQDFAKAFASVSILEKYFPLNVYPQLMRMKANECQLETFYRFWKEKENPSQGQLIIQKYDSYCGVLSDGKSADLSPLVRQPCWHLRRDMCVLCDGSVPFCKSAGLDLCAGNVLNEEIVSVWQRFQKPLKDHIEKVYNDKCRECDEYYTFNF